LAQTRESKVAFFFKQWGGNYSKAGGRILDDRIWDEMPAAWNEHINKWTKQEVNIHKNSQKIAQNNLLTLT
jgi:hypothetical protein